MQVFVNLVFDCLHHTRMPMADVCDTDTGDHVKVALALRTVQAGSFGAFDRYPKRKRRGLCNAMTKDISIKIHPAKIRRNDLSKKCPRRNYGGSTKTPLF